MSFEFVKNCKDSIPKEYPSDIFSDISLNVPDPIMNYQTTKDNWVSEFEALLTV